ncbi:hypothetical protein LOY46_15430 [Pseudomonas sichuanensis]|uniref:DUF6714 family protein n=1 Tax=Pseudomonas sichuanensis TaxID=2213015 RepID=UPI00215E848E|nr:DUF6714 family protein [Pseudomonas sichuanensis]UVK80974.1 hypothetical protein LOY46_15430 [Pseudomonas sichuanensis]
MREEDSLSSRKKAIRDMIEAAFGREDAPNASSIVDSVYPEPLQIREYFSGKSWWTLTLKGFHDDYTGDPSACLTFMTPVGMKYYLPAYLVMAVESYYEGDVLTLELSSRMRSYIFEDSMYELSSLSYSKKKAVAKAMSFIWQEYADEEAREALDIMGRFWGAEFSC